LTTFDIVSLAHAADVNTIMHINYSRYLQVFADSSSSTAWTSVASAAAAAISHIVTHS